MRDNIHVNEKKEQIKTEAKGSAENGKSISKSNIGGSKTDVEGKNTNSDSNYKENKE